MQPKPNLTTLNHIRNDDAKYAEAFEVLQNSIAGQASFSDQVVPAGIVNGTTVTFGLPQAPNPASSLHVYVNGLLVSATVAGRNFTCASAPPKGASLLASYRY